MIKRLILPTLLLFFIATFSSYGAIPAEYTVCIVGGLGDQNGKAYNNGGGATLAAWAASGDPNDFMSSNGGPKTYCVLGTYTHSTTRISSDGIGSGVIVGTIAYIEGTNITTGWTKVTAVPDANTIEVAEITATGDNTDTFCLVGGALDTLQNALDCPVNNGASYNRYIYDNIATETISAQIDSDLYGGGTSTFVAVIGYNATLTAEAEIEITTLTDLGAGALLRITTSDYVIFKNIAFNGGGKDSNYAGYCLYGAATTDGVGSVFVNCKFRGAEVDGAYFLSSWSQFINCEFYLNGRYGLRADGWFSLPNLIACSVHDNDNTGIYWRPGTVLMSHCVIYDNGKDGTGNGISDLGCQTSVTYDGCTIYNHPGNGIDFSGTPKNVSILNTAFVSNLGYSVDTNGVVKRFAFFGHNLSAAPGVDHIDTVAGAAFATYGDGNNVESSQTADQLFETITDGSEDFTPETGSDLIDAGLGVQ